MVNTVYFIAMSVIAGVFIVGTFLLARKIDRLERELKEAKGNK